MSLRNIKGMSSSSIPRKITRSMFVLCLRLGFCALLLLPFTSSSAIFLTTLGWLICQGATWQLLLFLRGEFLDIRKTITQKKSSYYDFQWKSFAARFSYFLFLWPTHFTLFSSFSANVKVVMIKINFSLTFPSEQSLFSIVFFLRFWSMKSINLLKVFSWKIFRGISKNKYYTVNDIELLEVWVFLFLLSIFRFCLY